MIKPALRVLLPYVIGIIIASYFNLSLFISLAFTVILAVAGTVVLSKKRSQIANIFLIFAVIGLGFFRYHFVTRPTIPSSFFAQNVHLIGHVTYHPETSDLFVSGQINLLVNDTDKKVRANFLVKPHTSVNLRYGDVIEFNGVLRRPSEQRNPGGFDYRAYLMRKGIRGIIYPWESAKFTPKGHDENFCLVWIDKLRRKIERVIEKCTLKHSLIVKAIILGRRQDLPEHVTQAFRDSGVFHVLAVSGLHVGLVAMACFSLLSLFGIPRKVICGLTIGVVIIYAGIVGFRTSVIRASLIISLYLFARIIDRDSDILNLLGVAALIILLINPIMLWDVGFQLTFLATAAIVYLLPKWESILRKSPKLWSFYHSWTGKIILVPFIVSLSAQVATQPLIARYFNRIYPSALLSNVPVAWLIWYIASVSFATIIGGVIWTPLGKLFGCANYPAIELLLKAVNFFSDIPYAVLKVNTPKFIFFVLYVALFFAVIKWRWVWQKKRKASAIACLIFLSCIIYWAFQPSQRLLEVTFLDVGQGDSAFIHLPDGKNLLIDGGMRTSNYDAGEMIIEPFLRYRGVEEIYAAILTHPHNDHAGGFFYVLNNFDVNHFIARDGINQSVPIYQELCKIAKQQGILHTGNPQKLFVNSDETQIEFFPKLKIHLGDAEADSNNNSIVCKIQYGNLELLFTADIEAEAEQKLVSLERNLKADILKVPHHGSETSSTEEFVKAVEPGYAIFSVGVRNRFGFPSPTVIDRYRKLKTRICRTDQSGAITFYSDGRKIWVNGLKSED